MAFYPQQGYITQGYSPYGTMPPNQQYPHQQYSQYQYTRKNNNKDLRELTDAEIKTKIFNYRDKIQLNPLKSKKGYVKYNISRAIIMFLKQFIPTFGGVNIAALKEKNELLKNILRIIYKGIANDQDRILYNILAKHGYQSFLKEKDVRDLFIKIMKIYKNTLLEHIDTQKQGNMQSNMRQHRMQHRPPQQPPQFIR